VKAGHGSAGRAKVQNKSRKDGNTSEAKVNRIASKTNALA